MSKNSTGIISRLTEVYIIGLYCFNNAPYIGRLLNVILLLLVFLHFLFQIKAKSVNVNSIDIVVLLFCIYSFFVKECLLGQWSVILGINIQTAITIFLSTLLYLVISMNTDNGVGRCQLLKYISRAGVILAFYSVAVLRTNIIRGLHTEHASLIMSRVGLQSNEMGMCFGYSLIVSIYLYVIDKKQKKYLYSAIICAVFLLLTGSRKSIIFFLVGLGSVYLLSSNSNVKVIKRLSITFFISCTFYFFIMNMPILYNILGRRIDSLFAVLNGERVADSTYTRYVMIEYGKKMISQHPWFGHGFNSFYQSYGAWSGNYKYSHNNYIELMVSGGIVLTVIYYLRYILSLIKLRKYILSNKEAIYLTAIIVSTLVIDITTVSYYSQINVILIGVMAGYLKNHDEKEEKI